jgi:hypothetical protein
MKLKEIKRKLERLDGIEDLKVLHHKGTKEKVQLLTGRIKIRDKASVIEETTVIQDTHANNASMKCI